jgi:hypothetical protein
MGENEGVRIIEKEPISSVDVRKYFAITNFQKNAEQIDPDKSHQWNRVNDSTLWVEDNNGTVAVGCSTDLNKLLKSYQILVAEKTSDGKSRSVSIDGLSQYQSGEIYGVLRAVAPCLASDLRHTFIRNIINESESLKDEEMLTERLSKDALELLSDYPNSAEVQTVSVEWKEVEGKLPSDERLAQLTEFVDLVKRKMPSEKFNERMGVLMFHLKNYSNPYDSANSLLSSEMTRWVVEEREDTQKQSNNLRSERLAEFSIRDKITRPIQIETQLREILSTFPIEQIPDVLGRKMSPIAAEMVEMDKVVGGSAMDSWVDISDTGGRGFENVQRIVKEYMSGNWKVGGYNAPIRLIEMNGKYYINSDGRHRSAALKALGVAQIPALVTHID